MIFERPSFDDILASLKHGQRLPGDVTGYFHRSPRPASYGRFPDDIDPRLRHALQKSGIQRPYTHQEQAIAKARSGANVVLATPTASGKSLCFNVPVLDTILKAPESRALYIFPTKALAQDQYNSLYQLIQKTEAPIRTFTFDGDTPNDARLAVREHGQVVITNPDMLHAAILSQHTKWTMLFENLKWIVIDELHTYRGIFGSHVAHVLRRLLRIAAFHGSQPRFITCSATIANPLELAETLVGLPFELVDENGSPSGEHHLLTYNPPVVNSELQIRQGVVPGAVAAALALLKADVSTIVFAGSRLHVELILKYLRDALRRDHLDPEIAQGYRGGYLPRHRRAIEKGLREGTIKVVVATNALEMGIDIGSLDACIIAGYPGSIASFRQQAGRAGRRHGRSLAMLIAGSRALDQYLVQRPDQLESSGVERARINPKNLTVLVDHVKCAAFELPFEQGEAFGILTADETTEVLEYLAQYQVVQKGPGEQSRWYWSDRGYPANHVNLRGVPEQNFVVIDLKDDKIIAEVDFRSAHTTLHPWAIYHVDSRHYEVERLDYEDHKAYVREVKPDYYTTAMTYTRLAVLQDDLSQTSTPTAPPPHLTLTHGEVLVARKFVGFKKIRFYTGENVGYGEIHLPDLEMHTTACWFDFPRTAMDALGFSRDITIDALNYLAETLRTAACALLMCHQRDIGRAVGERHDGELPPEATPNPHADPTLFLYDSLPGGVGLAPEIHKHFHTLLLDAQSIIEKCSCDDGCPACAGPMPQYREGLRRAALAILKLLQTHFPHEAPA